MPFASDVTIVEGVSFSCPFCGLEVVIGVFDVQKKPIASHVQPACETFLRLDLLEFTTACRLNLSKTAPS